MRLLAEALKDETKLSAFLGKALLNGGEVDFLTIKHDGKFNVFFGKEVVRVMCKNLQIENSKVRKKGDVPEQKVVFKYEGTNLAELEMRNDGDTHYREMRFNMLKPKMMKLLADKIAKSKLMNEKVVMHGEAIGRFNRWSKKDTTETAII